MTTKDLIFSTLANQRPMNRERDSTQLFVALPNPHE